MDFPTLFFTSIPGVLAALLSSYLAWKNLLRLESHKEDRRRYSIGIVLQAELIHFYMKIKNHSALLESYAQRFSSSINAEEAAKYVQLILVSEFIVYKTCVKELGLLTTETAYGVVYCDNNIMSFIESQNDFLEKLPRISASTLLSTEAKNLSAKEHAVLQHIERIVPLLAAASKALPFSPQSSKKI